MNPEDAELVGLLMALKKRRPERAKRIDKMIETFEIVGIAKWMKGELSHLGFRAGLRYQENIDVASDSGEAPVVEEESIDEAELESSDSK